MRRVLNLFVSLASMSIIVAVVTIAVGSGLKSAEASFVGVTSNDQNSLVSAAIGTPSIRVTTYQLSGNQYTGTNYFTLNPLQDLSPNYFVMMVGATGNGSSNSFDRRDYSSSWARDLAVRFQRDQLSAPSLDALPAGCGGPVLDVHR